jgi:hypothetical protein
MMIDFQITIAQNSKMITMDLLSLDNIQITQLLYIYIYIYKLLFRILILIRQNIKKIYPIKNCSINKGFYLRNISLFLQISPCVNI